jgi:tRNA(Arg) A34 adenosine deaminase TadA
LNQNQQPKPEFMQQAIALSLNNVTINKRVPFGAVIVKDQKVIAQAYNEVHSTNDPTCHAEIVAIRQACKALNTLDLKGCDLYTSCEPCPMCLGAVYWSNIDRVYYGNSQEDANEFGFDDQRFYQELKLPKPERKVPMIQFMGKQALIAFETWLNQNSNPDLTKL